MTLILSPWNYPINLSLTPLIGALAAGDTAILKSSKKAPTTVRALSELSASTFPPSPVSMVESGPDMAEALLELPFNHIFFTGSLAIGRKVLSAATQTPTSTTLKRGGKSPALVGESADLKLAAKRIV
ncbi:aldehyde dehydrogenase family protein [Deinococcus psychrotolerans]|uniref:aldehyde dehydrogenase family protein n=1 Tax=Deinococcus psychrotolerans TaxID=2489213 RepID=UPI0013DDA9E3|nr:aldehyde dehydrogenase family protein [Deinococcus psychrotolerans]